MIFDEDGKCFADTDDPECKYYKERFLAYRSIAAKIATTLEVNEILEKLRIEARNLIPSALEVCILLVDKDAPLYTRPLQCQLYERPMNCLSCKRFRPAIMEAVAAKKSVVLAQSLPVVRHDGSKVEVGPEVAVPAMVNDQLLAVVSVVSRPGSEFTEKDYLIVQDLAETVAHAILKARNHWEVTQEKLKISKMLSQLSAFVPQSVRTLLEQDPDSVKMEKENREVTILFLDLEDYTGLSSSFSQAEVNVIIESLFSRFVDPIQRYHGEINETAGDGLMIIFQGHDARTNAVNAVKAAMDIHERAEQAQRELGGKYPRIYVNMGINSGDALVGMTRFVGSLETRMTYTASGPVTNIAARLAGHAGGGDILIGDATGVLIQNLWPVHDLGFVELKGIREPQRVYSMLKKTSTSGA